MKIIYITDIHDALRELRVLLKSTEADMYLLSGDILYKAFYDDDKIYQFVCLQEDFYAMARQLKKRIYPFDLATEILRFPDNYGNNSELESKATEYRQLFEKAAKTMKEKYAVIEEILVKYDNGADCVLLPGNYDIDLRYTALKKRDIHQKEKTFQGLDLAGYGGAPIATSGIPEKLAVVYHESQEDGKLFSEPEDFFTDRNPDIMVIHNPAYGFFDRVPSLGHVGSLGIRNFVDQNNPMLVVSGHVHEDYGVCVRGGTMFLNPSNFGGVDSPYGWQSGGMYAEIQLDAGEKRIDRVTLKRLVDDGHHELMHVHVDGDSLRGEVVNTEHAEIDLDVIVRDSSGTAVEV